MVFFYVQSVVTTVILINSINNRKQSGYEKKETSILKFLTFAKIDGISDDSTDFKKFAL